jgi:ParB-like chromosome segregation protein Spo0J
MKNLGQRSVERIEISKLKPAPRNARTHGKRQIRQIADSIRRFGFTNPVLVDDDNGIVAGLGA